MEGIGAGWAGGYDAPIPITDGKVDGTNLSFKAGSISYSGNFKADTIELDRAMNFPQRPPRAATQAEGPAAGNRPAARWIGPVAQSAVPATGVDAGGAAASGALV